MKKIVVFLLITAVVCTLLGGCMPSFSQLMGNSDSTDSSGSGGEQSPEVNYEDKLKELIELLDTYYVDDYNKEELGDYLAAAAVQATGDRWSYYISADEYAEYLENGNNEYVGIGVTVQLSNPDDPGMTVLEVNKGGSAHEAGILPGDMIVAVDGHDSVEMGIDAMSDLIKGKEGTEVSITVLREGKTIEMTLMRKKIQVEVVTYENLDGIGYIQIDNFNANCADLTIAAIEDLLDDGVTGLIFDLRYNPGGRKVELCKILDYLLPEGPLFRSVNYLGVEAVDSSDGESVLEMPMVVMVNGDSYSAAEFFAAAMQEYGWATIVGTQTVGKGNYQQAFPLSDGSAVSISTGHYSTPNGVNLEGVGITPDVIVEVDEETYTAIYLQQISKADDPQIQAALAQFEK